MDYLRINQGGLFIMEFLTVYGILSVLLFRLAYILEVKEKLQRALDANENNNHALKVTLNIWSVINLNRGLRLFSR